MSHAQPTYAAMPDVQLAGVQDSDPAVAAHVSTMNEAPLW